MMQITFFVDHSPRWFETSRLNGVNGSLSTPRIVSVFYVGDSVAARSSDFNVSIYCSAAITVVDNNTQGTL